MTVSLSLVALCPMRLKWRYWLPWALIWRPGGESTYRLFQIVGRIHCLEVVEMTPAVPYWLLARACSLASRGYLHFLALGSFSVSSKPTMQSPWGLLMKCLESLWSVLPHLSHAESLQSFYLPLLLQRPLVRPHVITLGSLRISSLLCQLISNLNSVCKVP